MTFRHERHDAHHASNTAQAYGADDATALVTGTGLDAAVVSREIDGKFMSAFVRATKPAARAPLAESTPATGCCGPECCN